MPETTKKRPTLATAARALRAGGRALGELTGEDEPEMPYEDVLKQGFRRLMGVTKPVRRFGSPD